MHVSLSCDAISLVAGYGMVPGDISNVHLRLWKNRHQSSVEEQIITAPHKLVE